MNSKQGTRYIKRRMGDELKDKNSSKKWNYAGNRNECKTSLF